MYSGAGTPDQRPQARGWVPLYTLTSRSLLTWVYTWVVWRLEWPRSSWTTRRSAPPSSRWVAKLWRSAWAVSYTHLDVYKRQVVL